MISSKAIKGDKLMPAIRSIAIGILVLMLSGCGQLVSERLTISNSASADNCPITKRLVVLPLADYSYVDDANLAMHRMGDPDREHLTDPIKEARKWALSGLPFVYTWSDGENVRPYLTIPAFGASWFFQSWYGRSVPWVGLEYAEGLIELDRYDDTLPWGEIGRGIL